MFQWHENNLRKIRAHGIKATEVEQALAGDPILIYEQDAGGENRYVYYGETHRSRLLAIVLTTERNEIIQVVTAYDWMPHRGATTLPPVAGRVIYEQD